MKKILFSISMAVLTCTMYGQSTNEIGLLIGAMNYQGDLVSDSHLEFCETNLVVGANYRSFLSNKVAFKAGVNVGKITGSDLNFDTREGRGVTMNNTLVEVSAQGEWHPFGTDTYSGSGNFKPTLSPYIGAGLGMLFASENISVEEGASFLPEDAPSALLILPFDAGLHLTVTPQWALSASAGTRATFSDLLDGVSNNNSDWIIQGGFSLYYMW